MIEHKLSVPQFEISSISENGISYTKSEGLFSEILYNMTVYEGIVNETGEVKLNGFKVNKLGDYPLKLEKKPE